MQKSLAVAAELQFHMQVHHHVLSCIFQHTYHRSTASGGMLTGAAVSSSILSASPSSCCIPSCVLSCTCGTAHLHTYLEST